MRNISSLTLKTDLNLQNVSYVVRIKSRSLLANIKQYNDKVRIRHIKRSRRGKFLKYDKQECPQCEKQVVTLYKKKREDIALCYWCNKKREKQNKVNA